MAQLDGLKKIEKSRNTVHSKVSATYSVFEDGGRKYVQIDTYGKTDRENPGVVSQSIQLDRETAQRLVELLSEAFDLK